MRWYVKKTARASIAIASWAGGGPLAGGGAPRVRALTYHRIGEGRRDPFCVSPEAFESHVRVLAEEGRAVSLDDVIRFVAGRRALPDGACLLTIDDGCESTLTRALPILERWRVPAVAFVTSSFVATDVPGLPERYLDWDELRALSRSNLVEVGSHAYTHRSLAQLDSERANDEARRSKEQLEEGLGREVRAFAYPFGMRPDFDPVTERALAEAGYRIAFNSMHGCVRAGMDPISLPRVKVEGGEGTWMFRLLSRGAMDRWRVIDQNLWRFQWVIR